MNRILIIVGFFLIKIGAYSQVFIGKSSDNGKPYNCRFEIIQDSVVLFHYATDNNEIYACHLGSLKKIDGNKYHVTMTMVFGKFDVKSQNLYDTITNTTNDTDYISIDTAFTKLIGSGSIEIEYKNGQIQNYSTISNYPVALDKKYYNKGNCCDYYLIKTQLADPIRKTGLRFMVRFGSSPDFVSGDLFEFDILMTNDTIQSISGHHLQTGQFRLKKSST